MEAQPPESSPVDPCAACALGVARDTAEAERFRLLVQHSSDILIILDADGTIRFQSPSIERNLGHKPEQRVGRNVFRESFVHPEDADAKRAFLEAVRRSPGEPVTAEFRLRHADGSWRVIEAVGTDLLHDPRVAGIVANYRDVTERTRAERERADLLARERAARARAEANERRYRTLAEALPQLVWTARPDGDTDYFSRRWADYTGLDPDRSIGWGWLDILHPDDRQHCRDAWERATRTGEAYEIEYRLRGADGRHRWFLGRALPLRDDAGRIAQWFGTCTDIDDRKRDEAALEHARRAAEDANRSKDQFLAMLSHELRTPLTPVLMMASALEEDRDTPAGLRPVFAMIRRNVALEARMIDDLLDVTRIARGKMAYHFEVVDAHAAIGRALADCLSEARAKRLDLVLDASAGEHHVRADAARLQQVIWNLVRNATKFTPEGGRITVRTRDRDGLLRIEVSDTGMGIPAGALARIFDAFDQGEESVTGRFGGLGLGLAISRSIAAAHGGSLTAASAGAGRGATFTFALPTVAPAPRPSPETDPPTDPVAAARPVSILLVEDDPTTARVTARLLQRRGYRVRAARSIAEALAAPLGDIDLIVSDIGLPDGSGFDLMRRIRARRDLPGIALTGFGRDEDIASSRAAGFVAHITKPVDFARLKAAIRGLIPAATG